MCWLLCRIRSKDRRLSFHSEIQIFVFCVFLIQVIGLRTRRVVNELFLSQQYAVVTKCFSRQESTLHVMKRVWWYTRQDPLTHTPTYPRIYWKVVELIAWSSLQALTAVALRTVKIYIWSFLIKPRFAGCSCILDCPKIYSSHMPVWIFIFIKMSFT